MLGIAASWMVRVAAQNQAEGKLGRRRQAGRHHAGLRLCERKGSSTRKSRTWWSCSATPQYPQPVARDTFAYKDLIATGKVHCVRQTIDADKQVINYDVGHQRFGSLGENGGSTEHVFEAQTFDGKTIAGRARAKSPQKSFKDVPYTYDITFSAAIEPKK